MDAMKAKKAPTEKNITVSLAHSISLYLDCPAGNYTMGKTVTEESLIECEDISNHHIWLAWREFLSAISCHSLTCLRIMCLISLLGMLIDQSTKCNLR